MITFELNIAIDIPDGSTKEFIENQMQWVQSQVESGLCNFNDEELFLPGGYPHKRDLVAGEGLDKVGSWELY